MSLPTVATRPRVALLAALGLVAASSLSAQVILSSNLTDPNGGTIFVSTSNWQAGRFNTDATHVILTSVTFDVTSILGKIEPKIYTDAGGRPGTATDWYFSNTTSSGTQTLTASAGTALSPNTTYWVVWDATLGSGNLESTFSTTATGVGVDSGVMSTGNSGTNWSTGMGQIPLFSLSATAVPEPATYGLMAGFAAIGLAAWVRRRRATRHAA